MVSGSEAVIENLRAGGISAIQFSAHADQVTIGIDNTVDVYYTLDGTNPVIGTSSKVTNGASEATIACPAGPTIVKLLAASACTVSVVTGNRSLSRPKHTAAKPVADL